MPKLIDADKLLECLIAEMKEFDCDTSSHYSRGRYDAYEWVTARINSGTFYPTPVQTDTPSIQPKDRVRHTGQDKNKYGVGTVIDVGLISSRVKWDNSNTISRPLTKLLEVIKDDQTTKEA